MIVDPEGARIVLSFLPLTAKHPSGEPGDCLANQCGDNPKTGNGVHPTPKIMS